MTLQQSEKDKLFYHERLDVLQFNRYAAPI